MRLEKCFFCSSTLYPGHGIHFVRNDSKVFRFCRSKCHKNFKMKRNPRKLLWTKAFRKAAGKEMTIDSTFEFEKRRHIPIRYDRDLMGKTLAAMNRIREIRIKREHAFHKQSKLKSKEQVEERQQLHEVTTNLELVATPSMIKEIQSRHSSLLKQKLPNRKVSKLSEKSVTFNE